MYFFTLFCPQTALLLQKTFKAFFLKRKEQSVTKKSTL